MDGRGLFSEAVGSAWHVLCWLRFQTSEYDHSCWFPDAPNAYGYPRERIVDMWFKGTSDVHDAIIQHYLKAHAYRGPHVRVDRSSVTFQADMRRLEALCAMLAEEASRDTIFETLAQRATGKTDQALYLHFKSRYHGTEVYRLRAGAPLPPGPHCPLAFLTALDPQNKRCMENIVP